MSSCERLENRRFFSATIQSTLTHAGTLVVQGTSDDDVIRISKNGDAILVNGIVQGVEGKTHGLFGDDSGTQINSVAIKRIRIEGAGGDDLIELVGKGFKIPVTMLGGNGNDTLWGGHFSETLIGGQGDDHIESGQNNIDMTKPKSLYVRSGREIDAPGINDRRAILQGGAGNDTIVPAANDVIDGNSGDDTVSASLYVSRPILIRKGNVEEFYGPVSSSIEHYANPSPVYFGSSPSSINVTRLDGSVTFPTES